VTVVVTCYNHQAYVEQSLESVAEQTRPAVQVIVIDDRSSDQSANLIERWLEVNQPDWTFLRHSSNLGVCASLNEALALARGKYFCQVSADDWIEPDRFERQSAALDTAPEDAALVVGDIREVNAGGGLIVDHDFGPRLSSLLSHEKGGDNLSHLLAENTIPAPGVMLRTDAIRDVGGYDESLAFEDYDMWLRLAEHHSIAYQPGIVSNYRLVASGMTRNTARRALVLRSEADMLAKHIGRSEADDRVIARRLLGIAGALVDLDASAVLRYVLRLAQPIAGARWVGRAIRTSRLPGGLDRIRQGHAAELSVSPTKPRRPH
jgi:glycosyltransferase involved in cell wall biosynthesis